MKYTLFLFVIFLLVGCESDDDNSESLPLLYNQWYRVGLCREQNSLLLNSTMSYTDFISGANDCNDPAPDTYKHTGTYEITDMHIKFNIMTSEKVIDGTNMTIEEFEDPSVKHKITLLSETNLTIESYRDIGSGVIQNLFIVNYER